MDTQRALAAKEAALNAPVIRRVGEQTTETETFVPAPQSRLLNGILGAAWAFQLLMVFTATPGTGPTESSPTILVGFATALILGLAFAMVGALSFAAKNDARTAPLSFAIATGVMVFGALCGLAGHPASTWLADVAFGAVVAAGSVAVFARRA